MMHLRDLQKLEGVLSPSHLEVLYYLKPFVSHLRITFFHDNKCLIKYHGSVLV